MSASTTRPTRGGPGPAARCCPRTTRMPSIHTRRQRALIIPVPAPLLSADNNHRGPVPSAVRDHRDTETTEAAASTACFWYISAAHFSVRGCSNYRLSPRTLQRRAGERRCLRIPRIADRPRSDLRVSLSLRQGDPTASQVHVQNLDSQRAPYLDAALRLLLLSAQQLGVVDQSRKTAFDLLDAHEHAERNDLGDATGQSGADLPRQLLHRIVLHSSERQRHLRADSVDAQNPRVNPLAHRDDIGR